MDTSWNFVITASLLSSNDELSENLGVSISTTWVDHILMNASALISSMVFVFLVVLQDKNHNVKGLITPLINQ